MAPLLGKSLTLQWQRDKSHSTDTISHHFRVLKKVRLSDCWVGARARLTPCSQYLKGNNSDASSMLLGLTSSSLSQRLMSSVDWFNFSNSPCLQKTHQWWKTHTQRGRKGGVWLNKTGNPQAVTRVNQIIELTALSRSFWRQSKYDTHIF